MLAFFLPQKAQEIVSVAFRAERKPNRPIVVKAIALVCRQSYSFRRLSSLAERLLVEWPQIERGFRHPQSTFKNRSSPFVLIPLKVSKSPYFSYLFTSLYAIFIDFRRTNLFPILLYFAKLILG